MQQREELWYDALDLVGHEHLIAVELNLVLLEFDVRLYLWEIEDTREVEGVIDVEVDPEQRLVAHGVEGAVEALVVLVLQGAWGFCPQRLYIIDDIVLFGINLLTVFPFCLLAEGDRHSHELAVFLQQTLEFVFIQEFLAVVVDVEDDIRSVLCTLCVVDLVRRRSRRQDYHRSSTSQPLHLPYTTW